VAVLDIHELPAGKRAAILARRVSRDLFDAHHLAGVAFVICCDVDEPY